MKKPADQLPITPPLTESDVERFRATVYAAARANPRTLPWRESVDPYRVLVSEVMLQQTQADRVTGKFADFVARFPTAPALASAELSELLTAWQGLGYNRRALALKRASEAIVDRFGGEVPSTRKELESLPGIGPYTAGAIMAFAFYLPELFIETNIRSVFIHHFFQDRTGIHDRELLPLVATTLDRSRPRDWYNALMDYGVVLKRDLPNPSRKSIHHLRQSRFEGSNRQQRSALLKAVLAQPGLSANELAVRVTGDREQIALNLARMEKEGLMVCTHGRYSVTDRP